MSKFTDSFRKFRPVYIWTFIIFFLIGAAIFLVYYLVTGCEYLLNALNGVTIAFVALLAAAGFSWLADQGTFDMVSYGFKQVFASAFSKKANKYNDLASYKQEKEAKRESGPRGYFAVLFASIPYALAVIVLEILYNIFK